MTSSWSNLKSSWTILLILNFYNHLNVLYKKKNSRLLLIKKIESSDKIYFLNFSCSFSSNFLLIAMFKSSILQLQRWVAIEKGFFPCLLHICKLDENNAVNKSSGRGYIQIHFLLNTYQSTQSKMTDQVCCVFDRKYMLKCNFRSNN